MPIWLSIILAVLQYAPEIIKAIIDLFRKAPKGVRRQLVPELKEACMVLVKTRDKRPLQRLKEKLEEIVKKK